MATSVILGLMYSMDRVFLYKCNNYNKTEVDKVIRQLVNTFDVLRNIRIGSRVIIKANLVSAMEPCKAATTHPILLAAITEYLHSKKCAVVIGDSPGGVYTKTYLNHVYTITKMHETGAELNNDFSTKKAVFEKAKVLKSFEYTAYLDDCDLLINFSKLKTHGMMGMSCAVKNLFGTIPGTLKPEYHYRFPNHSDFANMLIDLNEYFKPAINIVDAIVGMEGNGPTMGDAKNIGCILASQNPYALDYICAQIIGLGINDVETVKQSKQRHLFDENKIWLNDNVDNYIVRDFNVKREAKSLMFFSNKNGFFSRMVAFGASKLFTNKPYLKKNKCIGCGKCAKICPAKAIVIDNKKAKIDRGKCIKCYCCQEFCPVGAMVVKSSLIMSLLHKNKIKERRK